MLCAVHFVTVDERADCRAVSGVCLVYLDDIIVHSRNFDFHLDRLSRALLKLQVSKCRLLQQEAAFVGHRLKAKGLSTNPAKVEAVREWPILACLRGVRAFFGLCSKYRNFVPEFSEIAALLHSLTVKNGRFQWDEVCQESFEKLKGWLISSSVLELPIGEGNYIVDADASESAVGAVLSRLF